MSIVKEAIGYDVYCKFCYTDYHLEGGVRVCHRNSPNKWSDYNDSFIEHKRLFVFHCIQFNGQSFVL